MNDSSNPGVGKNAKDLKSALAKLAEISANQKTLIEIYVETARLFQNMVKEQSVEAAKTGVEASMSVAAVEELQGAIEIIVRVRNSLHNARNCIGSVLEHATGPYRLIVVNDGSDRYTSQELRTLLAAVPHAKLIESSGNSNSSRALKKGIEAGTASICILLDSDAILSSGTCERIRDGFAQDSRIGVITAVSTQAGWALVPFPAGASRLDVHAFIAEQSDLGLLDIAHASGSFLAVRRSLFSDSVLFDIVGRPGDWNDAAFSMMAMSKGWRVVVDRQLYVHGCGDARSQEPGHDQQAERDAFAARWQSPYMLLDAQWRARNPLSALAERLSGIGGQVQGERVLFLASDGRKTQFNIALVQLVNALINMGVNANIMWPGGVDETLLEVMPMHFKPIVGNASAEQLLSYNGYVAVCQRTEAIIAGFSPSFAARLFNLAMPDTASRPSGNSRIKPIWRAALAQGVARNDDVQIPAGVDSDIFYPRDTPASFDVLLHITASAWDVRSAQISTFCTKLGQMYPAMTIAAIGAPFIRWQLPGVRYAGDPQRLADLAEVFSSARIVVDYDEEHYARLNFLEISASGAVAVVDAASRLDPAIAGMRNCLAVPFDDPAAMVGMIGPYLEKPDRLEALRSQAMATAQASTLRHEAQKMAAVLRGR